MTDLRTPEAARANETIIEDELVAADDTIIGRAFVWSLLAFVVIALLIAGMVWMMNKPPVVSVQEARAVVPPRPVQSSAATPLLLFEDITRDAGLDFVHINGATGEKLLPETMGGGVAFLDINNDHLPDLIFINSMHWPERHIAPEAQPTHALYLNDGTGRFTNITAGSGLDFSCYGMGLAVGDYDNDGWVDIFIAALGRNYMLRNNGDNTFTDVTDRAQLAGDPDAWSTSAAFFDYDNDGHLDLFVCNYVRWSRELDFSVNYTLVGIGRAYGPPSNFEGMNSYLYRNNGDGTFSDVSESAGIHVNSIQGRPMGKALGVAVADFDRDGCLDILVANDTVQNFVFHNQRDGTFKERGSEVGMAFDRNGLATGAMGVDIANYRNNATLGAVIGNFANEMSSLYVAPGDPMQFTDEAITEGIGGPTRSKLTFGTFFFDADLDGRLDLLQANGHIEDEINVVQPSQHYRQPAQLFWNAGPEARACYVEMIDDRLGDLTTPIVGRGAAYADIDGDGDLDVILTQVNGPPLLLRNNQPTNHAWLRVNLIGNGTSSNRDAIGAQIIVTTKSGEQRQTVMPARSYLSCVERIITFGLGDAETIDGLRIIWPDGAVQQVKPPAPNQVIVIQQP